MELIIGRPGRVQDVEIFLDVLSFILTVLAGLTIGIVGCLVVLLPVALFKAVRARSAATWLACSLTLLVGFDEQTGRFHPSVQLRGKGVLRRPWIRLELVDGDGTTRLIRRERLSPTAIGTEFQLPTFEPPDGVSAEDALGWHWDIVIEDKGSALALARWREHPRPVGYLNAEAELA